jgi:phosphodiesterase/alkaline phosphatase D-like protein
VDVRAWVQDHPGVSDAELLDIYRQLYRGYFNQPGIRALQEAIPSFLIWDDHEIFNSYGAQLELSDLDHRLARVAFEAYREYQHLRNPGTNITDEPPYHYSFWYADTGFFMFDLRSQRNYCDEQVVGQEQWVAFGDFLEEAASREVETVFIGCSIPVVHFSPTIVRLLDRVPGHEGDNTRDRWDAKAFTADRDRIIDMVCDWQAVHPTRSVAILSGDVHAGAAFSVSRKDARGGRFVQWTSSALSSPGGILHTLANRYTTIPVNVGSRNADAKRHGVEPRNNFGIVEVVPRDEGRGHQLSLSIYGYDPKRRRAARTIHHRLG